MSYEPMSTTDIEQQLRESVTTMTRAELQLRDARDAETDAEITYRREYRKAMLSSGCPRVSRGGHTVADRDAWVDNECAPSWEAFRIAQTRREAAQDHVRTARDVATALQSICALVRVGYAVAGAS